MNAALVVEAAAQQDSTRRCTSGVRDPGTVGESAEDQSGGSPVASPKTSAWTWPPSRRRGG
ncbi:hypothetical protein QJS66_19375 [Kocuria rhizophila]|nr:hypothetical protein QJS66_19375 [Kocuria rhizophila]